MVEELGLPFLGKPIVRLVRFRDVSYLSPFCLVLKALHGFSNDRGWRQGFGLISIEVEGLRTGVWSVRCWIRGSRS